MLKLMRDLLKQQCKYFPRKNQMSLLTSGARTTYHPMGTAAMGKVVDTNLKVQGVKKLRIVDTSVFPVVIAAHLQQATYALAEQAAEIIKCSY
jgi:choline dehydrogenase